MGATGRFCRACLVIRYGISLEEVKAQQESGEWLCPHCYEDDHPDEVRDTLAAIQIALWSGDTLPAQCLCPRDAVAKAVRH